MVEEEGESEGFRVLGCEVKGNCREGGLRRI